MGRATRLDPVTLYSQLKQLDKVKVPFAYISSKRSLQGGCSCNFGSGSKVFSVVFVPWLRNWCITTIDDAGILSFQFEIQGLSEGLMQEWRFLEWYFKDERISSCDSAIFRQW